MKKLEQLFSDLIELFKMTDKRTLSFAIDCVQILFAKANYNKLLIDLAWTIEI